MRSAFATALVGSLYISSAYGKSTVVLESRKSSPDDWMFESFALQDTHFSVSIALAQPKLADLEAALLQRASSHSHVPALFSSSQLEVFQTPAAGAATKVISWLARHGVTGVASGPWVKANTTVNDLHSLFEADMAYYTYNGSTAENRTHTVLRTLSYSIPDFLAGHVDFVHPLTHFLPPRGSASPSKLRRRQKLWPGNPPGSVSIPSAICVPNAVMPDCIRAVYNWPPSPKPHATSPARFGIAGFLDEYINYKDVTAFLQKYGPRFSTGNLSVELINGGINIQAPRSQAGLEASLDVQYAVSLASPTQVIYYSTGGRGDELGGDGLPLDPRQASNEPYLSLLEYLVAMPDDTLPHVLSISYSDDEQSVPRPYAVRVCQLFMQLTARGTTVLVASGDGGSAGIGRNACRRNDGSGERALLPTFPSSCPWVTSVGATDAPIVGDEGVPPPPGVAAAYSSGGFSDYFARPAWQNDSVRAYVLGQTGLDKQGLFNRSGRAVPDIAAMGSRFQVICGGWLGLANGTSASTPVVAAMVVLANDKRLRAGRPALGWLNPVLYSDRVQHVLQDITDGESEGCSFGKTTQVTGWTATPGWDAVTGLGVPSNVDSFVKVLADA